MRLIPVQRELQKNNQNKYDKLQRIHAIGEEYNYKEREYFFFFFFWEKEKEVKSRKLL